MKKLAHLILALAAIGPMSAQHQNWRSAEFLKKVRVPSAPSAGAEAAITGTACIRDSAYNRSWNSFNNSWSDYYRTIYSYDAKLNCTQELNAYAGYGSWTTSGRILRTFDAANNNLSQLSEYSNSPGNWTPNSLSTYTYNSQGKMTNHLFRSWEFQAQAWKNNSKRDLTYDQGGNRKSETYAHWTSNAWQFTSRETYTYSSGGDMLQEVYETWDTGLSNWINDYLVKYNYDIFGNLVTATLQTWGGSTWEKDARAAFSYTTNNRLHVILVETWDAQANSWINDFRMTYTYDASGHPVQEVEQYWNPTTSVWENSYRYLRAYDSKGNNTFLEDQEWDAGSWKKTYSTLYQFDNWNNIKYTLGEMCFSPTYTCVINGEFNYYYNCTTVGLNDLSKTSGSLRLYPNPVSGTLTLDLPDGTRSVIVSDVTGKIVLSAQAAGQLDVNALESGLYLLTTINEAGAMHSAKFLKE